MNDILGLTVENAINALVTDYKENSGQITVFSEKENPVFGLYFHEGSGFLVTTNPVMNNTVYSVKISGIGYYKDIELFTR